MAELSARQGRIGDAVAIYRHLLASRSGASDDERRTRWTARLASLERAPSTMPISDRAEPIVKPAPGVDPALEAASSAATSRPELPESPQRRHTLPLLVSQPVRSGQIVYAENTDLIVLAPVNPGAELLADGNIHVYSSLRGRALAGARGATGAQVFCLDMQAELVGVDSGYLACEQIPPAIWGKAARVWLRDGQCQIELLTAPAAAFAINRARRL
jgi:septum site-determining protein MinC